METDQQRVRSQLRTWQSDLLDLSNRNQLLNFRFSTTKPTTIKLEEPSAEDVFGALLDGKTLTITGTDDIEAEPEADLVPTLPGFEATPSDRPVAKPGSLKSGFIRSSLPTERTNRVALRLFTRAKASMQEQGIGTLYLALGLLKWQERPSAKRLNTDPQSPIVLVPVAIEEDVRTDVFRIHANDDPEFNLTLVERLRQDYGLDLGLSIDEDARLADVLTEVRRMIAGRTGWDIRQEVHLGHFQFHKLRMYKDLDEHADLACQHDILRALALDTGTIASFSGTIPLEDGIDRRISPADTYSILDADASQRRAIEAATKGSQFIVSGPPGTGKSQTIANIIAESIAANKTVLFVSEKTAAIEVVHRRLTERGLGDLCLMLHSHKANKNEVIQELGARLDAAPVNPPSVDVGLRLRQLIDVRQSLDDYADALHRVHQPFGRSAFWGFGQLAALQDVPLLSLRPPPMAELTPEVFDHQSQVIQRCSHHLPTLQAKEDHPWSGFAKDDLSLADRSMLRAALESLGPNLESIRQESADLARQLGLEPPSTLNATQSLLGTIRLIPRSGGQRANWLDPKSVVSAQALADQGLVHATAAYTPLKRLLDRYQVEFLSVVDGAAISAYGKNPFVRFFSSEFKRYREQVRGAAKNGKGYSVDEELDDLRSASEINTHLVWFRENESHLVDVLGRNGDQPQDLDPERWKQVQSNIAAARSLLERFNGDSPPQVILAMAETGEGVEQVRARCERLDSALARINEALITVQGFFTPASFLAGNLAQNTDLNAIRSWMAIRSNGFDQLDDWLQAQTAMETARNAGLAEVVAVLRERNVPAQNWTRAYQRLVITHWLDWVIENDHTLRAFREDDHVTAVERFRTLDHFSIDMAALRLHQMIAQRSAPLVNAGEPAVLLNEREKKKRHMPLRRLFQRIPNLIPRLKPCLMMSPLSVAQFLPANLYRFDIVIFDEASQVRPHDAIGAIMRGKQLIVAGDSMQLPPTSFFDRAVDEDEPDDDRLVDIRGHESILDLLRAKGMQPIDLLWHYRSRHEDLIAFSNHHIYNGKLITFPAPIPSRSNDLGVRLEYVADGRYVTAAGRDGDPARRVNTREAEKVVELIFRHARTRPNETLGVVTLGMNHKETIDEALKHARQADPSLEDFFGEDRSDPFFVKALEQVQGDERDVMIISIGYGKNESGSLSHNFGPINQQGGNRRLNVLVTRARNQVVVVSSIKAEDIDLSRTSSLGPSLLRNYLEFAERGPIALATLAVGGSGDYESPFEEEVGEALRKLGYQVHRQVGSSKYRIDLAIVHPDHPGRYLLGIECDGKTYHQAKTARDRDRLRQEILESLGWTIHRVWSTSWIRNPERELELVVSRIQTLLADDRQRRAQPESHAAPAKNAWPSLHPPARELHESAQKPQSLKRSEPRISRSLAAAPYVEAKINTRGERDLLNAWKSLIADNVSEVARVEGPIHHDLLVRRISSGWGYDRAGNRIAACIDAAIRFAEREEKIVCRGNFIWATDMKRVFPRGVDATGNVRRIEHIADEELLAGMRQVLDSALSLSESDLAVLTARFFGYQRSGRDIKQRFERLIPVAIKQGMLTLTDDQVRLASGGSSA